MTAPTHFLDISSIDASQLRDMLDAARARKQDRAGLPAGTADADPSLDGRILAMLFERPSLRTRVSFDMAMRQLGGTTLLLSAQETHLKRGEEIGDTARVLSRLVDAIMIRTGDHARLLELAEASNVPVINGLTERTHPCQVLGDILTIEESFGDIEGKRLAWCGDGNNVLRSFVEAAGKFPFELAIACPPGHGPDSEELEQAKDGGAAIRICGSAAEAVRDVDCVMTDTWRSMDGSGDAGEEEFSPYQVDAELMSGAGSNAVFLHCMPAYRGQEVAAEVIDGGQSRVLDQAENRLHIQKAILLRCLLS